MFTECKKNLTRADHALGSQTALDIAPVYLIPKKVSTEQFITYSLERLLLGLEKNGVMFDKSNALIPLIIESNPNSTSDSNRQGFCSPTGEFKSTIEKWIMYYKIEYHSYQGIVLLDIRDSEQFIKDSLLIDNMVYQIQSNKKRFLFFIMFDEDDKKEIQDKLNEVLYTDVIERQDITVEDYIEWIESIVFSYKVMLDKKAREKLSVIIEKNIDKICFKMIDLWAKSVIWSCVTADEPKAVIGEDYICEEDIMRFASQEEAQHNKIGFS